MKSEDDLGALVKQQHPGYSDLSNEQVGQLVKQKFPDSYNDYFDRVTYQKVSELLEFYNPNNGKLTSWWRKLKAGGKIKHLEVINQEARLVLEQGAMLAEAGVNDKKQMVEFEMFLAEHQMTLFKMKAEALLEAEAIKEKIQLEEYNRRRQTEHINKLKQEDREHKVKAKLIKRNNKTDNELRLQDNKYLWEYRIEGLKTQAIIEERRLNNELEIDKQRQLKGIDFEFEDKLAGLQLQMTEVAHNLPEHLYGVLSRKLSELHNEYEEIKELDEGEYKDLELKRIKKAIKKFKSKLDERS